MEAESNANDLKQQVVQYCRDFLGDVWSKIDKNEIIYKEIGGGFQNINIFCAIPYHVKQDDVPQKVIVHLYGKDFTGQQSVKFCGEAAETVIIERLSQLNLVPKLFGVFQGGRIEEFIESTTPTVQDLRDPELNGAIARKLAKIHSMKMPISKVPLFLEFYAEILLSIDLAKNIDDLNPKNQEFVKRVFEFPFKEEVEWFTSIIPKIQSRVVFSHNDLYSNNILLKKRFDSIYERPLIIDYEMSGYFYRGYDIACYLKMKNFDIDRNGDQVKIIYIENEREEEDKKHFLTEYLQEWLKVSSQIDANLDNIEQLEKEAVFFSLLKDIMFIGEARLFINFFDESKLFSTNTPHIPDYFNNKRKVLQRYGLLET